MRIFYDQAANRVVGVEAGKGKAFTVRTKKAVILATGGFSGSAKVFDDWVFAYFL